MTQKITKEQAARIITLDDFKRETGAKRFKRTKDEMDLGLSPEKALEARVKAALAGEQEKQPAAIRSVRRGEGEIVIRIVPQKGMEWDPDWTLPTNEIIVEEDDKFYSWLDEKLIGVYSERHNPSGELVKHILDFGLGEVITQIQLPNDFEDERINNSE